MLNSQTKVFFKEDDGCRKFRRVGGGKSERCSQCKPDIIAEGDRRLSFADTFQSE